MAESLESRIQRLEDIEAIKRLKATYCYLVDEAVAGNPEKAEELMGMFVEDAWGEYGEFGRFEGKESLTVFFRDLVPGLLSFSSHMVHNPLIDLDGEQAKGSWYFEVPCTLRDRNLAGWLQGVYEEEYVKVEGKWMWRSIRADFRYGTPYDEGWARTRMFPL